MEAEPAPDRCALEALFLAQLPQLERVIELVVRRRYLSRDDAEEFASTVKFRFVEQDYEVLRAFQGRSSLKTYVTVVVQRMFLDYRNKSWGKWRPSAEAERAGPLALLLEQLIARDGYAFEEAWEILKTNHGVSADCTELERLAGQLPVRWRRRFESTEALACLASNDLPVDKMATETELQAEADRLSTALKTHILSLAVQDRLILTLRFEDGRTVAEIAGMLHLDQKGLYRRVERLLKKMRKSLESEGVSGASLLGILESSAVSIEWSDVQEREKGMTGPSKSRGVKPWR